jgi:hypothetical protein
VGDTISKLQATMSKLLSAIQASIQTHKWWWAGGGGAAVVAIAALVIVFGGFFGPSGKAICTIALEHARDYGVIPTTATLANTDAKSTDVKNRRVCTAQTGGNEYRLVADITCKNMKNKECIALYSVERADGLSTYQVRQVPNDDTDAAADTGSTAAGGDAQSAGDTQNAAEDSDIQTTTGTHGSDTNQQAGPQQ